MHRRSDYEQVDNEWRNIESFDEFTASAVRALCFIGIVLTLALVYVVAPKKVRQVWKSIDSLLS